MKHVRSSAAFSSDIRLGKGALGLALAILAVSGGFLFSRPAQEAQDPVLTALLGKLSAYAARLEGSVLDFVCREEIAERIDPALDVRAASPLVPDAFRDRIYGKLISAKNHYVYDYQCVRGKNGLVRETRTLLDDNGKKTNVPDAKLKTEVFVFGMPLLGPVGIFAERFRPFYDYKITGREKVDGKPALIIEATPTAERPGATNLYGKAWVGAEDGEILKIEWSESRVGRREIFEERAEKYQMQPRITLRSEFSAEKNGIRFPSMLWMEEAYLNTRGRAFIRSTTTVAYKDFKFFTVEVDVR
ncbi:MAG: hypothetical protein NTZ26_11040 [Candidatus Aminicenantes bacterium]|nr:hypothetical protein [Candidatus Aminicenantes bacterium]